MGKGVFLNVSGGGHVIATYGIVAELVRRGERIVYFEVPPFQQDIEALGAEFRSYGPIQPYTGPTMGSQFHHEIDLPPILTWCALEWIPQLLEQIRALAPDYIVHDSLCVWGKVIAQLLDVPAVCSIHTPGLNWPIALSHSRLWREAPGLFVKSRKTLGSFRELERTLRAKYGVPRMSFMDAITNRQPVNLCHTPRELQPHDELLDRSYHFIASVHSRPTSDQSPFPLDRLRETLIYIGFGTICDPGPQFFRNCLAAFTGIDRQVVMVLSASTKRADLGPIPDNFIVWSLSEDGMAPQFDILPRAELFVMNGGMGGAREAAWNGVPMLAFGTTFETYMISKRIEQQGAGLALPPEASSEAIRRAAMKVLDDPAFARNSARIGEASRTAGGAAHGADLILEHARRGAADLPRKAAAA